MIQHGPAYVCAACKPVFLQRIQEGVSVAGNFQYGGFWIRFAAKMLDGIILFVINMMVYLVVTIASATAGSPAAAIAGAILNSVIQIAIACAYETWFVGKYGATPGKMACGLRVVMPDGGPVSYARAVGRYFAQWLDWFTLTIGFIIAAFDDQKRALHDRICETRVIYK